MTNLDRRQRILTGLRANNDLTIGNYLGALLPMIDMAKSKATDYDINLFIPDLHSFTTPINHDELQDQIMQNLRIFVAAGLPLDHENVFIYRQSYVPAHSELTWILDCFTGFGEMNRMTQFKDKGSDGSSSVGLFNYPVLMAADILLYNTSYVPVGDDQTQHLEFTRDIGERMNKRFGNLFTVPHAVPQQHAFFGKDQGLRIRDLQDPTKKMSKSDESGKGVIFMNDTPESATKKIMSAATDSEANIRFDWKAQPGVTNLLQILALFQHRDIQEVVAEWQGKTEYGSLKKEVAGVVADFLRDFQTKLNAVDTTAITEKLEWSERAMNEVANATLLRAQQAVGLRPRS